MKIKTTTDTRNLGIQDNNKGRERKAKWKRGVISAYLSAKSRRLTDGKEQGRKLERLPGIPNSQLQKHPSRTICIDQVRSGLSLTLGPTVCFAFLTEFGPVSSPISVMHKTDCGPVLYCHVLSCTVIIHIQPTCFQHTGYHYRVMACIGRCRVGKCDHHRLLLPMHLEQSSSQLLSPAQIRPNHTTWCLAQALQVPSVSSSIIASRRYLGATRPNARSRGHAATRRLSFLVSLFSILVDFDTPGKQNQSFRFSLSIRYLSTNLTYPHIQSHSPHTHTKKSSYPCVTYPRSRFTSSVVHIGVTQVKRQKKTQKKEKKENTIHRPAVFPPLTSPSLS